MKRRHIQHTIAVNATYEWFDKLAAGNVNKIFREAKPYWCERLGCVFKKPRCIDGAKTDVCRQYCGINELTAIKVIKGYSDEYLLFDLEDVSLGKVTEVAWTDPTKDYFRFTLGKQLKYEPGIQNEGYRQWKREQEEKKSGKTIED